ncbi:MAG: hypothetical protein AB1349_01685 [Elusimicrobiota bacterium]
MGSCRKDVWSDWCGEYSWHYYLQWGAGSFTDDPVSTSTKIRVSHMNELRDKLKSLNSVGTNCWKCWCHNRCTCDAKCHCDCHHSHWWS